jgi:outer membrane receptor protein involved in Fe transport
MNFKVHHFVRAAVALSVSGLSLAQTPTVQEEDVVLEEIVVTAQKREESLRDVPLSVEAVLGDKLVDAGIVRLDDLKSYVPNLQMTETGIANNIYIRGIGSGLNQGFEQSVSLYQDGVYHGRGHQSRMPFVDLARVEVLRGPQPILFGKNAVAGAVNLIANAPSRELEGFGRVSYDVENDEITADVALSGPFTDTFRGRIAAFHRHADGYMDNATLGTKEPRRNDLGGRVMLAADLSDALTATLRLETGDFDTDGRQIEIFGETPITSGPFAALPAQYRTYSGALGYLIATNGGTTAPNPALIPGGLMGDNQVNYVRSATGENYSNNEFREAALTFDYNLAGGGRFTSVSAFSKYQLDEGCDCDFIAAPLITAGILEDYKQYSQELRFASDAAGRFQWIGGLFFQKYELDEHDFLYVPNNSLVPALVTQSAAPGVAAQLQGAGACASAPACQAMAVSFVQDLFRGASNPRDFSQDSTMYSAFLQGTIKLNDFWSITLGGRLSNEEKDGRRHSWLEDSNDGGLVPAGVIPTDPAQYPLAPLAAGLFSNVLGIVQHDISGSRKETSFSPLFNVQYRPSPDAMAYLSVSQGVKSGGFDARSNKPPAAGGTFEFKDERATTYEVGVKKSAAGGRAELSVAGFFTDYKDLQTSAFDGRIGFNVGNGSAEVRGIEFEGRWRPFGALLLKGSFAALDFEWKKYMGQCYFDRLVSGNVDDASGNCNYAGETNQLAPNFTSVVSAEYAWNLGPLTLTTTLDATHSSKYRQSLNLDPRLTQEAFTKLNARIGLGDAYDRWQIAVVGRNLTDKTTVSYAADAPLALALFRARSYYGFVDPPRGIAVEGRFRF